MQGLKFFLMLAFIIGIGAVASFRPKQQPCQCNCEKPSVSVATLQVAYDKTN